MNIKKKKPKIHSRPHDDEPVRLDLANLIKLSGLFKINNTVIKYVTIY